MQESPKRPRTDEVNGHPHYELFAGLRHICPAMQMLHLGFDQTNRLVAILHNAAESDQSLDERTLQSIAPLRFIDPLVRLDQRIKGALHSLSSAKRHIEGSLKGQPKVKIEDRLKSLVEEAASLKQDCEAFSSSMLASRAPCLIRQVNLGSLWLECRPIVVQITDLLHTTTPRGVGEDFYGRLKQNASLLRGIIAALEKWRDEPGLDMAKGFARCYANWVMSYNELSAIADAAEKECRRSGLLYMGRMGYKTTEAEHRRLQLPPNTRFQ